MEITLKKHKEENKLLEYLLNDKKNLKDNELRFILLSSIGNAVIHSFSIDEVGSLIGAVKELWRIYTYLTDQISIY